MANLSTRVTRFSALLLGFLILVLTSLYIASNRNQVGEFCDLTLDSCSFEIDQQAFEVQFVQAPQIEQRLQLKISADTEFAVSEANIRGINMFMGVTPVVQESKSRSQWIGWTLLGACSEPNMIWQLTLSIQTSTQQATKRLRFTTSV